MSTMLACVTGLSLYLVTLQVQVARCETISGALARAYSSNPDLNQQRASTRATDEGVSQAKSRFRPQVQGTGSVGFNHTELSFGSLSSTGAGNEAYTASTIATGTPPIAIGSGGLSSLRSNIGLFQAGVIVTENIFNGNKSANGLRQAESEVMMAREATRSTEQTTLQNGATAYMNVLRDTAILELTQNNLTVLESQISRTRERFNVGGVTGTDVAQAASSVENARSQVSSAKSSLRSSIASYQRIFGVLPEYLEPARPLDTLVPHSIDEAVAIAMVEHPSIQSGLHAVDVAQLQVQIEEAALYPTLDVVGNTQATRVDEGAMKTKLFYGGIQAQLNIPIYSGGASFSSIRKAKETLTQRRLQVDLQRSEIRADVKTYWGMLQASKEMVRSSKAAVKASELALSGVREEAKVGQRTTFDVLVAQQNLLQSRVSLVSAEHDRVVATYAVAAATGRLSAATLGLDVVLYDPSIHYEQVKDKWLGLRTPSGK